MKFLETITFLGSDVLVPIDRIKYINLSYSTGYSIKIFSDDGDWEECFGDDEDKAHARYLQIKSEINRK